MYSSAQVKLMLKAAWLRARCGTLVDIACMAADLQRCLPDLSLHFGITVLSKPDQESASVGHSTKISLMMDLVYQKSRFLCLNVETSDEAFGVPFGPSCARLRKFHCWVKLILYTDGRITHQRQHQRQRCVEYFGATVRITPTHSSAYHKWWVIMVDRNLLLPIIAFA